MNLTEFKNSALSERVAIYVPSTIDVNKPFDNSAIVAKVAFKMSLLFGGATQESKTGYYISNNGELVKESVTVIYSNTDRSTLEKYFGTIITTAKYIKTVMSQEAITVEVNGAINFI